MRKYLIAMLSLLFPLAGMAQQETETTSLNVALPQATGVTQAIDDITQAAGMIATAFEDETTEQPTAEQQQQPQALQLRFGVISRDAVMKSMPDYLKVEQEMEKLKAEYEAEAKRSADEFNAKYETFLNEQRNYAPSIMRKRQVELEEMMRSNENFRIESHKLLRDARQEALRPLQDKINEAIRQVSIDLRLLFVLNADADRVPYYLEDVGVDITETVKQAIK